MKYNTNDKCFKNDWFSLYPRFSNFYLVYGSSGYFDERPLIHCFLTQVLALLLLPIFGFHLYSIILLVVFLAPWGELYLHLPIRTGRSECEPPRYGIYYHSKSIWICYGRKLKCFHMPYDYNWVRTSVLLKDGTWEHETRKNRKGLFGNTKSIKPIWEEEYPYTYTLKNGNIQHRTATIKVEEREWRQRWLMWTKLFSNSRKTIDIKFGYAGPINRKVIIEKVGNKLIDEKQTGEVGEKTGSWKGGTTGCGYEMLPNETPLDTLRRMEKERKF